MKGIHTGRITILLVAVLIIGGGAAFILAWNLYPEKHYNIKFDGKCYELTGDARRDFERLQSQAELLRLETMIRLVPEYADVKIAFIGTTEEIKKLAARYGIEFANKTDLDGKNTIAQAVVDKKTLESVEKRLSSDFQKKTAESTLSILARNDIFDSKQQEKIHSITKGFMSKGIKTILAKSKQENNAQNSYTGVKESDCSRAIEYKSIPSD